MQRELSVIKLSELLMEFTLSLDEVRDRKSVIHQIELFGELIGRALAERIREDWSGHSLLEQAGRALDCVLFSMGATYPVRKLKNVVCYDLDQCPIQVVAKTKDLMLEVKSLHQILMAICQSLVQAIHLTLTVKIPKNSEAVHTIKIFATTGERKNSVPTNSNGGLDRKNGQLLKPGGALAFVHSETPPPLLQILGWGAFFCR